MARQPAGNRGDANQDIEDRFCRHSNDGGRTVVFYRAYRYQGPPRGGHVRFRTRSANPGSIPRGGWCYVSTRALAPSPSAIQTHNFGRI
jgi:hypothetical protein